MTEQLLRNLLVVKLLRLNRLSNDFIPDDTVLKVASYFITAESRDDRIANERLVVNNIKIIKQVLTTLVTAYLLALLWYRFSDYWQQFIFEDELDENYFVVRYGLRPPSF